MSMTKYFSNPWSFEEKGFTSTPTEIWGHREQLPSLPPPEFLRLCIWQARLLGRKFQFTVFQPSERRCQLFCSDTIQIVTMCCMVAVQLAAAAALSHSFAPLRLYAAATPPTTTTAAPLLLKALLTEARQSTLYHHDIEIRFYRVIATKSSCPSKKIQSLSAAIV